MILQQFPDLGWLKTKISQRFADRRGPGNLQLETDGFPSVIIHATTRQAYRPDVLGPISLFATIKGNTICTVDGRRMVVTEDTYCISNRQQNYTLEITGSEPVETFNIHIGEHFSEKVLQGFTKAPLALLDNVNDAAVPPVDFYNKLYRKDEQFNNMVKKLLLQNGFNKMQFEETLAQLMMYLLQQHKNVLKDIAEMPPVKAAVKAELYKRVSLAADYIHACYLQNIQLEDIAASACLSKFHFLRLFKQVYKTSPYQYIQQLRTEKALQQLAAGESVQDIALLLGYENSNSLSRIFKQRTGLYPTQYRN